MQEEFDIIVLGSGLGGLECGVMLSREGLGVCVVEQAAVPGGCLQSFRRRGHFIDTGMHYVGRMQQGGIMRRYFDYFGIGDSLEIRPLDEAFDIVSPGGAGEFAYMHGYDEFRRHLTSLFPREAAGIARYCDKIREIGDSIGVEVHRSGRLSSGGVKYLGASAAEFIGECVADPLLRSVLAGTNPLYGGVRERSPLYHHAMINHSNIEGACRFAGGTQHIADALAAKIREHGGTILAGCRASALHTEGRRVTGVELADGRSLRAKSVISAIHPAATFGLIGPTPVLRRAFRDRMAGMPGTYGLFSVYLLLRPQSFPYINRNHGKFTVQTMKEEGIGTAEFDFIHLVRHNPGITQTEVRETLKIDKGAAARRAASLEAKGYLERKPNPADGRSQLLYATKKAEALKNSKASIEAVFYEWLLAELPEEEKNAFCETLDKLYWRSKNERRAGFVDVAELVEKHKEENIEGADEKKM